MSGQTETQEFGKWRSFFWPIHSHELKKLLPMFFMSFFILFNYTVLRDTKDTLIVTASGAETIAFLKFWGVVPGAIIFMLIYSKLSNILSKENLFYVTIAPFIVFFASFALFIYPNREALHPVQAAAYLEGILPQGLSGLIACFKNWTYSLFYILSELWGSVALSLLFWGFANDFTKVTEAKRFYNLFGVGGNIALLCSGPLIIYFSGVQANLPEGVDPWGETLNWLMGLVVIGGLAVMALYWYMQRYVLTDPRYNDPTQVKAKKSKPKMSLTDSCKYLLSNKYMLALAVIVMAYGMSINFVEVTWKSKLKEYFTTPNSYSAFMGLFSTITGLVTIFMMLFVGSNVIRTKGWKFAALVTPTILLITGLGFFSFVVFQDALALPIAALGATPLFFAVVFGMAQNILSKSCKYSLFDPTKEMAYIPLDQEQKVKGKAAVDVVGARFGKSGGALVQQGLIILCGSLAPAIPIIAVFVFGVVFCWFGATRYLGKEFTRLTSSTPEPTQKEGAPVTA